MEINEQSAKKSAVATAVVKKSALNGKHETASDALNGKHQKIEFNGFRILKTETLSEFVWKYAQNHTFCSKAVIAGKYVDTYGKQLRRGMEKTKKHKSLMRKVAYMFTTMKNLGLVSTFSKKTVRVNRSVFNAFTLEDILNHKKGDSISQKSISISLLNPNQSKN